VFVPLRFIGFKTAYCTWQALNVLALAGALFLLILVGQQAADGWAVAALMVLYPPVFFSMSFARGEMILLLLVALALIAMKRQRDTALGVTLGVATLCRTYTRSACSDIWLHAATGKHAHTWPVRTWPAVR
jgi:hypothetical protein